MTTLYECGVCSCLHPWEWEGDCRDDTNRFSGIDDYINRMNLTECEVTVVSMEERVAADLNSAVWYPLSNPDAQL